MNNKIKSLVLIFLLLFAGAAMAQSTVSLQGLRDAMGAPGDKSVNLFSQLLPEGFFVNPMAAVGGANSLIGNLFLIFNGAVFVVGVMWATYGILGGIAQTAHSGEFLGKQMSVVWMPIRMVTGIVGIVPIFAGFSMSQVLLVTMAGIGIGMANLMWAGAIDAVDGYVGLTSKNVKNVSAAKTSGVDFDVAADDLFLMYFCQSSFTNYNSTLNKEFDGVVKLPPMVRNVTTNTEEFTVEVRTDKSFYRPLGDSCGRASFSRGDYKTASKKFTGFNSAAISEAEMSAYYKRMTQNYLATAMQLDTAIATLAAAEYKKYVDGKKSAEGSLYQFPRAEIKAVVLATQKAVAAQIAQDPGSQFTGAINAKAKANMQKNGWIGAGAWFSTFAEANTALQAASRSGVFDFDDPSKYFLLRDVPDSVQSELRFLVKTKNSDPDEGLAFKGSEDGLGFVMLKISRELGILEATNDVGNVSPMQALVNMAIARASIGDDGLVNPITVSKNLGDYSLLFGQGMWLYGTTLQASAAVTDAAAGAVEAVPGVGWMAKSFTAVLKLGTVAIKKLGETLVMLSPYFIALGLMFAVYIPMIPFIVWMGAVTQYGVVVCQGLVGAPIAALSHLDAQGEGMGHRSEAGYMFLLNVTFRPALMLMGFFLASGLLITIGTLQVGLFQSAMANAQGDSIAGIASGLGYLAIYLMLNLTLIHGLFNMIFLLPDQVLGMIGSAGNSTEIGKDSDAGVKNHMSVVTKGMRESAGGALDRTRNAARPAPGAGAEGGRFDVPAAGRRGGH